VSLVPGGRWQNLHVPNDANTEPLSVPARPELTGGRKIGVLLSHGFTGSPASMKPWARHLAEQGYAVEVPLLPGHGTTWQELNTKRFSDFYAEVSATFDKLRAENDAVVLAGLSMGATLMLRLAVDRGDQVAGVVIVNAAVGTRRFDVKLLPVLKHLVPGFPAIANDIKKPGGEEYAYSKTPLKAIHSLFQAFPVLIADLPRITAPVLYFHSLDDHVVDSFSVETISRQLAGHEDFEVRDLLESYHVATLDNDAPQIFDESAKFIERVTAPSP
jgi:carboxylesterase